MVGSVESKCPRSSFLTVAIRNHLLRSSARLIRVPVNSGTIRKVKIYPLILVWVEGGSLHLLNILPVTATATCIWVQNKNVHVLYLLAVHSPDWKLEEEEVNNLSCSRLDWNFYLAEYRGVSKGENLSPNITVLIVFYIFLNKCVFIICMSLRCLLRH